MAAETPNSIVDSPVKVYEREVDSSEVKIKEAVVPSQVGEEPIQIRIMAPATRKISMGHNSMFFQIDDVIMEEDP